jgi:hypothetical protein
MVVRRSVVGALIVGAVAGSLAVAAPPEILSQWRTAAFAVDGNAGEWQMLQRLEKLPLSGGFANDGEALYVCLLVSEPAARMQIMRGGVVLWVDVKGGTKKLIGFRFPVVSGNFGRGGPRQSAGGEPPEGPPPGDPQQGGRGGMESLRIPEELQESIEILGQKKDDRRRLLIREVPGLAARLGNAEGQLIWEMRLPLAGLDRPGARLGMVPGAIVGLRIETAQIEEDGRRGGGPGGFGGGGDRGGGMGGRGGMGGMGGRGGRGGMGGPGGRGRDMGKSFGAWFRLRLAAPGR